MALVLKEEDRRLVRTVFQLIVGLAAALPFILAGVTLPGVGVLLGVAAFITRVMALPQVEELLTAYVPWLAASEDARKE